ncbi:Undecaprenyl phosphate-alpha-4-amino-4-deoxy-L-arabinose arabinosyl transferase [Caulifigura coniformis]|uniref:Undecaprenyl phosphate-alpha-4-amino-4-deoxy-L-arabinose arabinosyl transferase n=1 Tax=Caulifigura coniformis TaxID=2527983 RepID=A0A517SH45_9PLAN|nr:glycosyltransferase family 39 protein [Caulifigura coniformis]QDT55449.1 Undecaprenyl phosphate-alpha-4-amino-4-deoxy-L-arabinose arabinosyl transferase [Caulifigura coniformis]
MKRHLGHQALIIAVAACSYFTALGATRLWDEDEAFFATAAAEMHRHDDWIVPTFNEELFAHKPPFMYWMMRLGFLMFGVNELGARFFSAVFGIATAIVTYHLGRRLFDARAGLWAALALSTCLMWSIVSRASTADAYLGFFIALSLLVYARAVFAPREDTEAVEVPVAPSLAATLDRWVPSGWTTMAGIYALMAFAVLVKGPIGILLPGATIGLFVLCQTPSPSQIGDGLLKRGIARLRTMILAFPATFWRMRPLTAIAAVLLIAGPWFVAVAIKTDGAFLNEFFGVHNFGRFLKPMENHRGPIIYYIPVIAIGFFPWSIFAMPTALHSAFAPRDRSRHLFVLCWAGWMIGFFSIASTKLPNYVLPAYPALALLTGSWLAAWSARKDLLSARWPKLAFGTLATVGVLLIASLLGAPRLEIGGEPLLSKLGVNAALAPDLGRLFWLGFVPLAGGVIAIVLATRERRVAALWTSMAASTLFTASVLIVAAIALNPHQTSAPLASAFHRAGDSSGGAVQVGSFRHSPPSLIFYAGQHVERLKSADDAAGYLSGEGPRFLVTTDVGLKQLEAESDKTIRVIDRRPRFPRTGDVLLISFDRTETSGARTIEQAASEIPEMR